LQALVEDLTGIKMAEKFDLWKNKFDINFGIKPVMTYDVKVA